MTLSLSASPIRDAKRTVNGFNVDLAPLFKWWQKREGERPLPAWKHLTGQIVGTNSGAWIVEGKSNDSAARGNPHAGGSVSSSDSETVRILLLHPPVQDAAEFQRLLARLAQLNQARTSLVSEKAQARDRDQAVSQMERASRRNRAQARVLAAEDKQLKSVENRAETQQKPVEAELAEIKRKLAAYPKPDQYVLDCFALDLHSEYQRMPVYDCGNPSN